MYIKGVGDYNGTTLTGATDLASYLTTRLKGIKTTGNAEKDSGAAIGSSSYALAYEGKQRMYDVANHEYINVIYTNRGTVSVGEETCAIGEFSFAAGQGNNGGGNVDGCYYRVASSYKAGDEYIYLKEEPVGQYISFKESSYDDPSGDHVVKIVSKSYDDNVWKVRLAEPYIDRNINADDWVYPITGSHGQNSSSFGMLTIAQGDGSTVVGKYNYPMPNELFSVGCGTGQPASLRKNALLVLDDGSIYIKGVGNYDGTNAGESGVLSLQDNMERGTALTSLTNNTVEGGKKYNIHLTSSANTLTISTIENSTYESIIYLQIDDNANSEISLPAIYKSVGVPSFEDGKDYIISILDGIIVCGEINETSQTV
jgi:hypothetical protein